ncbi:MAG: hypothetical protein BWZ02_01657 [Lentisphaerae bacterium ADurb.BinA184]|nr:MAG: hypothetical protein BWZ02_01657 [Lentisphaerae bacterium ADurb.BinA184]
MTREYSGRPISRTPIAKRMALGLVASVIETVGGRGAASKSRPRLLASTPANPSTELVRPGLSWLIWLPGYLMRSHGPMSIAACTFCALVPEKAR